VPEGNNMKRIILALVLSLIALPAFAQDARVVTNCKGVSPAYDVGTPNVPMTIQPDGTLCISGASTTMTIETSAAVFCVAASAVTVSYLETY
jgi:hypothetical protein